MAIEHGYARWGERSAPCLIPWQQLRQVSFSPWRCIYDFGTATVGGGVDPLNDDDDDDDDDDHDDDDDDGNDGASPSPKTPCRSGVGVVVTGGDVSGRVRKGRIRTNIGTIMETSLGKTVRTTCTSRLLSLHDALPICRDMTAVAWRSCPSDRKSVV